MQTNETFVLYAPSEILGNALKHPATKQRLSSAEYRTSQGLVEIRRNQNGTVSVIARKLDEHYEYEGDRCIASAPIRKLAAPVNRDASILFPQLNRTNFIGGTRSSAGNFR